MLHTHSAFDQNSRIPLTVVSGPPQAGKSTLVRHLLERTTGQRLSAVVRNPQAIDPTMIANRSGDLLTLRNGCTYCIAEDDASMTLASLARQTPHPQHVVVDVDGWSDPRRLAGYGYMPGYCLDGTVAVLDAASIQAAREDPAAEARLQEHLRTASIILLNKVDLTDEEETERAHRFIKNLSGTARIVLTDHARVAPPLLIGFGDGPSTLDDRVMFFPWSADYWPGRTRDGRPSPSAPRPRGERHRAWCLTSPDPIRSHDFRTWVQHMPPSIMHARGSIHLGEEPQHRYEFYLFGPHWRLERGAPWNGEAPSTRVMLAGLGGGRPSGSRVSTRARAHDDDAASAGDAA